MRAVASCPARSYGSYAPGGCAAVTTSCTRSEQQISTPRFCAPHDPDQGDSALLCSATTCCTSTWPARHLVAELEQLALDFEGSRVGTEVMGHDQIGQGQSSKI